MYAATGLALVARREGRFDVADTHLRSVLQWHRTAGFEAGGALILAELGFIAELRGGVAPARSLQLDGFVVARRFGDPRSIALAMEGLAGVHAIAESALGKRGLRRGVRPRRQDGVRRARPELRP